MSIFRPFDWALLLIYTAILILTGFVEDTQIIVILFSLMTVCSLAWIALNRRHERKYAEFLPSPPKKMPIGQTIGTIFKALFVAYAIMYLVSVVVKLLSGASTEEMSNADEIGNMVQTDPWMMLVVVVSAPIIEEVVFRGIIFRQLNRRSKLRFAIIISSVMFALLHFVPLAFFAFLLLGALLAYLYHITNRLWAPMALHFMINGISMGAQIWMNNLFG